MTMTGTPKEKIWSDIDKSGIELEIGVASLFQKESMWWVSPNSPYEDLESRKGREIDMICMGGEETKIEGFEFSFDLVFVVECKKIPGNSWAFFPCAGSNFETGHSSYEWYGQGHRTGGLFGYGRMDFSKAVTAEVNSIQYRETVLDRKKSNGKTNNIYTGLMELIKASESERRREEWDTQSSRISYVSSLVSDGTVDFRGRFQKKFATYDTVSLVIPLLVFDGPVYRANLAERTMESIKVARLNVSYKSRRYDIRSMVVDVCTFEHLPDYLKQVREFLNATKLFVEGSAYTPSPFERDYDVKQTWLQNRLLDIRDNLSEWAKQGLQNSKPPSI